ncbi:MAG: PadR family transcriptional regulator [Thermoplasmata archaeon]|nr:PadR family transcriptional regulator [Thermoplasmata archaeon]
MATWGMPWVSRKKRGLRSWVLVILGDAPKTGAEVMDEMERMSGGWWRPSPGSVYPLLEELTQEGITRRKEDGRYELLNSAREQFGWRFPQRGPRSPADVVREIGSLIAYLEDLRRSDATRFAEAQGSIHETAERLKRLAN